MMDWTDRHCRYFFRLLSANTRLYTEMVTSAALVHGHQARHLRFDPAEHPLALQLGGSSAEDLARCAELGERWGYDEINLNCGCPSDRVQEGRFGACMMREPELVAECVRAMRGATALPVTVKHRIGVDDSPDYPFLRRFVETVAEAGCETFIVHARKAWLKGLSPKENREVPPLDYDQVYRLKQEFPQLCIIINGGITDLDQCLSHLQEVDGVMLGREIYENPWTLSQVDSRIFDQHIACTSRLQVIERYLPYLREQLAQGVPLMMMAKHLLGLYRGQPGGRSFRRVLSEHGHKKGAGVELLMEAIAEADPDIWAVAA